MNAYQITITDHEHWGDQWAGPAPFEIEDAASTMAGLPNAPVTVHLCEGATPERAAHLLRQVADALERNGRNWLPHGTEFERDDIGEPEKRRQALRVLADLEAQADEIRQGLFANDGAPF